MELRWTGVRKVVTPRAVLLRLLKTRFIEKHTLVHIYCLFVWTFNENLPTEAKTSNTLQDNFVGNLCVLLQFTTGNKLTSYFFQFIVTYCYIFRSSNLILISNFFFSVFIRIDKSIHFFHQLHVNNIVIFK